jgi:hypothetical protein
MKHIEARSARRPKLEAPGVVLDRGNRAGPPGSFPGIATSSVRDAFLRPKIVLFHIKVQAKRAAMTLAAQMVVQCQKRKYNRHHNFAMSG